MMGRKKNTLAGPVVCCLLNLLMLVMSLFSSSGIVTNC